MSDEEVFVDDLVSALEDTNDHGDLKRLAAHSIKPIQDTSLVDQKRANLKAANEIVTNELNQWAPIVNENMKQRTVTFENKNADVKIDSVNINKTEFGSEIDTILKQEKLTREAQLTLEDEALTHLSEEEIRARVEQMAKLRSLQFYNEQKAKRWKKIKSKQFRRLHKRDMADLPLEELAEIDPEAFKRRLEKIEIDRAKERTTLRHKNTSQWVRRVLSRGLKAASEDVKASFEQQVKLGEELTKKINGYGLDDDSDDENETKLPENPINNNKQLKGLFDMKFMKDAEARKEKELEDLLKSAEEAQVESEEVPATGIITVRSNQSLNMKQKQNNVEKVEKSSEKGEITSKQEENTENAKTESQTQEAKENENNSNESKDAEQNPWMKRKKRGKRFVSATSINQVTEADLKAAEEKINLAKKEEQREVIADIFGLSEEFQKEKEAQAAKEAERELPDMGVLHLEGWGAWAGPGAEESEGAKRRREKLENERKKIMEEAIKDRKDSRMPHVIYKDGVDKAVEKYSIPNVPKMYTNPKQLQAQLKYPIGPEFNSVSGFQTLIKPEMVTEAGHIIEPIFFTKNQRRKEKTQKKIAARKALETSKKGV
ncbi:hypothetical protein TRFO_08886 [Tritrichomonas foetus]|uniref:U3 small nucleolar RNA-associated protein 14 n=1 Tax=Tritrichomonas foetus TaxID=1144522 RepID=A0A1J4JGP9_9EUKA|nr:hypothetical protein TRFO_08886 [Tritrichomonas foetus]|eukprot:OHS98322.1 hypothetical protein TRFO_08886 [Tritrichomonas foetus]